MPETPHETLPDPTSQHADSSNETSPRYLRRSNLILLATIVLIPVSWFGSYRVALWYRQSQIARLGGSTVVGLPQVYGDMTYTTRAPKFVRQACTSNVGRWLFSQFPVVYAVDLREIKDIDTLEAALHHAAAFDEVRVLTLYQSAATDKHLALVASSFPNLTHLKVNETAITDAGIRHLRDLPNLELINAQRTAITDAAVADFASMHRLKELDIGETRITSIQPIRVVNPGCLINQHMVTRHHTTDSQR